MVMAAVAEWSVQRQIIWTDPTFATTTTTTTTTTTIVTSRGTTTESPHSVVPHGSGSGSGDGTMHDDENSLPGFRR